MSSLNQCVAIKLNGRKCHNVITVSYLVGKFMCIDLVVNILCGDYCMVYFGCEKVTSLDNKVLVVPTFPAVK